MAQYIEVLRMRADLRGAVLAPVWPPGVIRTTWRDSAGPQVHSLLQRAYRTGGGEVADYTTWFTGFTGDSEFDPSTCILAWSRTELVGVALCWSSAFIKDLCVSESWRRRGVGEALLRTAMALFAERGAPALALKVDADNPSGAQRLYVRCGFEVVQLILLETPYEPGA